MADTVKVEYLYPHNMLEGSWDERTGNRRVTVRLSGVSDGTGETDVIKVYLSDLKTTRRKIPTRTAVENVVWQISGMTVLLECDREPHAEIVRIDGAAGESNGAFDWSNISGKMDPGLDDRTGNILLTSSNMVAGDVYDITMTLRLKD